MDVSNIKHIIVGESRVHSKSSLVSTSGKGSRRTSIQTLFGRNVIRVTEWVGLLVAHAAFEYV